MVAGTEKGNWAWQKEQKGNQPWWSGSFRAVKARGAPSAEPESCTPCQ